MSGHYPPGVSGNEYQIAGPSWTGQVERACGESDVEVLLPADDVAHFVDMALGILTGRVLINEKKSTVHDRAIHHLRLAEKAYEDGHKVEVAECPFDGPVDAESYNGTLTWTCPMCGTEHEEDLSDDDF